MSRRNRDTEPTTRWRIWQCQECREQIGIPADHGLLSAMIIAGWRIRKNRPLCPKCQNKTPTRTARRNSTSAADPRAASELPW